MDLSSEKGFTNVILGLAAVILVFTYLLFFLGESGGKYGKAEVTLGGKLFTVDVARSHQELIRGLSGRSSIPEFGGMLFEFQRPDRYSIWMKDMRFPLDIIWLDNGQVVFLARNAEPPLPDTSDAELKIFTPPIEADEVVEVRGGVVGRLGVKIGDGVKTVFR